jgi:hypothetical protein
VSTSLTHSTHVDVAVQCVQCTPPAFDVINLYSIREIKKGLTSNPSTAIFVSPIRESCLVSCLDILKKLS